MSYSFTVSGKTKAEVVSALKSRLNILVDEQPVHENDRDEIIAAVSSFVSMVKPVKDHVYSVRINGGFDADLLAVAFGVAVSLAPAEA